MRWETLFDDLENQLQHEMTVDDLELRAEEERLRIGRLTVRDRIRALADTGGSVTLALNDSRWLTLRPHAFGKDWLAADILPSEDQRPRPELAQCILPLASIATVAVPREELRASVHPQAETRGGGRVAERIGLSFVLRDLCRRRTRVDVSVATGTYVGTIDRVGRDHLDLAVHEADSPRRQSLVHRFVVVPLDGVVLVRF
ncbi:hypothetical protein HQQ80_14065 [Microbacteriaceae bacterium VKM Ac-2855]|nr:hypothetical protein [Microbacteriaceae bacterium VKM Ac-2855]